MKNWWGLLVFLWLALVIALSAYGATYSVNGVFQGTIQEISTTTPTGTATSTAAPTMAQTATPTSVVTIPVPTATPTAVDTTQINLPIEVLGTPPVIKSVTVNLPDITNITTLWLRIHGMESYPDKASIRLNNGNWLNINNTNVIVAYPANLFEGIGGAFNTVKMTIPLERLAGLARDSFGAQTLEFPVPLPHSVGPAPLAGVLVPGNNTIDFRYNKSDGLTLGFRVIGINFLRNGQNVLPDSTFVWEDPSTWQPPLNNPTDIAAGKNIFQNQPLSGTVGHPLLAACADCHATDGRDLKYFNYSNYSINLVAKAHGLTDQQANQVVSYIRSINLNLPAGFTVKDTGRPWNPPYQPGPGLDAKPAELWSAGAGIDAVLDDDNQMLPYMFPNGTKGTDAETRTDTSYSMNVREIPVAIPLPDWNHWLPPVDPMDSNYKVHSTGDARADFYNSRWYKGFKQVDTDLADFNKVNSLLTTTKNNVAAGACAGGIQDEFIQMYPYQLENPGSTFQFTATKNVPSLDYMAWRQLYTIRIWELHERYHLDHFGQSTFPTQGGGHDRVWFANGMWAPFGVSMHVSTDSQQIYPYNSRIKELLASTAWYELQEIIDSGNKSASSAQYPFDWNYGSNWIINLGVASGHWEGLRTFKNEFVGLQEAANKPNQWYQCNTNNTVKQQFYFGLRDWHPSRGIFQPSTSCIGPAYQNLPAGVWADLDTLYIKSFLKKIREKPPAEFPRNPPPGTTLIEPDGVFSFNGGINGTNPNCGFDDVWVGRNEYRALQQMKKIGVDLNTMNDLVNWEKSMWPSTNWDYWR